MEHCAKMAKVIGAWHGLVLLTYFAERVQS